MSPLFVFILILLASIAFSIFAAFNTPILFIWVLAATIIPMLVFLIWGINKKPLPAKFLFWLLTPTTCFFGVGAIFMWTADHNLLFTILLALAFLGTLVPTVKLCMRMKSMQDQSLQKID